jgi:low temperature requirement protein LtrA
MPCCSVLRTSSFRLLHLVLSAIVVRNDPDRRGALLRFAPTAIFGASLLVFAGFLLEGRERIAVWLVALAIDYLGPVVIGVGRGWRVAPEHFAEHARADHPDRARRVDHRHRRRRRVRPGKRE